MKTLLGLALLAGFFWVLKVISDGLVDKVPDAWARKLANAKPEDFRVKDEEDLCLAATFHPANIWREEDD
jgi:hypothetical protein